MSVADFLMYELKRRQARNARYSLRAFSRDLGSDHATVSQWIRGKRPVTRSALERLCMHLGVEGPTIEQIESFDPFDLQVLDVALRIEQPTIGKIATQCNSDPDRVNISVSRLLRLNLLIMNGDRWIIPERNENDLACSALANRDRRP